MQLHRRPVDLAQAADEFISNIALDIDNGGAVGRHWLAVRWCNGQRDRPRLARRQVQQRVLGEFQVPVEQVRDQAQADGHRVTEGIPHRKDPGMGDPLLQGFIHVDVSPADDQRVVQSQQTRLDAPAVGRGRHPDDAPDSMFAGRHHQLGRAHRLKGEPDAEIGHAEFDDHRLGILLVMVDHLGAQLGRLAGDRRFGVHRDFPLGVPGPLSLRKSDRRRWDVELGDRLVRQLARVVENAIPDRDGGRWRQLGRDFHNHLDRVRQPVFQRAHQVPLGPAAAIHIMTIWGRAGIDKARQFGKLVADHGGRLAAAGVAIVEGKSSQVADSDGRLIRALQPEIGEPFLDRDKAHQGLGRAL